MQNKVDPVVEEIEIASAYYEGQSPVIYLLKLALMAVKKEAARKAAA